MRETIKATATTGRPRGRPKSQKEEQPGRVIKALDRALVVLRVLSQSKGYSLTDLSRQIEIPPSTTHRILSTLQQHGFVSFDESGQQWSIGIEAFRVGNAYINSTHLVDAARGTMRRLMEETGETANLAIAHQGNVVFISEVESNNPIRAFFSPGTRGQMHSSGIGKALLANYSTREVEKIIKAQGLSAFTDNTVTSPLELFSNLKTTLKRGWSFDDEERYLGMRCVAACIFNSYGEPVAGISVSGPTLRFPDGIIQQLGPKVKKAANEITDRLGGLS